MMINLLHPHMVTDISRPYDRQCCMPYFWSATQIRTLSYQMEDGSFQDWNIVHYLN